MCTENMLNTMIPGRSLKHVSTPMKNMRVNQPNNPIPSIGANETYLKPSTQDMHKYAHRTGRFHTGGVHSRLWRPKRSVLLRDCACIPGYTSSQRLVSRGLICINTHYEMCHASSVVAWASTSPRYCIPSATHLIVRFREQP